VLLSNRSYKRVGTRTPFFVKVFLMNPVVGHSQVCEGDAAKVAVDKELNVGANTDGVLDLIKATLGDPHNFLGFPGPDVVPPLTEEQYQVRESFVTAVCVGCVCLCRLLLRTKESRSGVVAYMGASCVDAGSQSLERERESDTVCVRNVNFISLLRTKELLAVAQRRFCVRQGV